MTIILNRLKIFGGLEFVRFFLVYMSRYIFSLFFIILIIISLLRAVCREVGPIEILYILFLIFEEIKKLTAAHYCVIYTNLFL